MLRSAELVHYLTFIHFQDRGDGVKATPDIFYRKIKSDKESLPPIFVSEMKCST